MKSSSSYKWIPGTAMSPESLLRMKTHFSRPASPWIDHENRYDPSERKVLDPDNVDLRELEIALANLCSGNGVDSISGWDDWFHYFLPSLLARSHEGEVFERTISGFMDGHWSGIVEKYPGFSEDIHSTLGRALMDPKSWPIDPTRWHVEGNPCFSAQMFFQIKYLPQTALEEWIISISEIQDAFWLASLISWTAGVWDVLSSKEMTATFLDRSFPSVTWEASTMLGSGHNSWNFLEHSRRVDFMNLFRTHAATRIENSLDLIFEEATPVAVFVGTKFENVSLRAALDYHGLIEEFFDKITTPI